jgi:hypothetical protein
MNDIFKFFKKRSNKDKNINDIINEYNENDIESGQTNFDRASRSYVSMSKSGRLKAKKSHQRVLKDDIFQPQQSQQPLPSSSLQKQFVDQYSDNADSSASSVSCSSHESLGYHNKPQRPYSMQQSHQQEQQQHQSSQQRMSTGYLNNNVNRGYRY